MSEHDNVVPDAPTDALPAVLAPDGFDYTQLDEVVAAQVRESADRIKRYGRRIAAGVIAIGEELLKVKGRLEYGQWLVWLKAEFWMTDRTAENYMSPARRFGDKSEIVSILPLTVVYALSAPSIPEELAMEIGAGVAAGTIAPTAPAVRAAITALTTPQATEATPESEPGDSPDDELDNSPDDEPALLTQADMRRYRHAVNERIRAFLDALITFLASEDPGAEDARYSWMDWRGRIAYWLDTLPPDQQPLIRGRLSVLAKAMGQAVEINVAQYGTSGGDLESAGDVQSK
jgi:Protein of unknown function (DUF3102)